MTFCPRCGAVLATGALRCGSCGRRLGGIAVTRGTGRPTKRWLLFLVILTVVLAIAAVLLVLP